MAPELPPETCIPLLNCRPKTARNKWVLQVLGTSDCHTSKWASTPSSGKELQSEYFVPHHNAIEAIAAVAHLKTEIGPHLFITEIRTIDADELWMSPCYKQACVTIHFTWKQEWDAVSKLLPKIEAALAPYNARPHWGKLFTMAPAELHKHYKKLPDFKKLIAQYDPKGKFKNDFLERNVY